MPSSASGGVHRRTTRTCAPGRVATVEALPIVEGAGCRMGGYGGQVGLVLLLVLLNAAFAGTAMALISLRDSQIRRLERVSRSGRVLARLVREPNRFLATIQIGTLAGFLASAAAAVSLAEPVPPGLPGLPGRACLRRTRRRETCTCRPGYGAPPRVRCAAPACCSSAGPRAESGASTTPRCSPRTATRRWRWPLRHW
jgi:hypothetical protein